MNAFCITKRFALRSLRYWKRPCSVLVLLAAITVRAQVNKPDLDPFERLSREIAHAADEEIEQINETGSHASDQELASASIPFLANFPADTSADQANAAALHLEALGVNAKQIFREAGVPLNLLAAARVESNFDPHALSPKGAAGIWQFMPRTAQRYGLRVDQQTDDRMNPELETRAAAHYLRDLYLRFQDWPLALAAYNAGEKTVRVAMERNGMTDFWLLRGQRLLPEETRNYVPAILDNTLTGDGSALRLQSVHWADIEVKGYDVFAKPGK